MQIQKKKLIGVDIGSAAVKAVRNTGGAQGWRFGWAPMPEGVLAGNQIQSPALLGQAVKRAIADGRLGGGPVALTLSGNDVIIRHTTLPKMTPEQLRQNVIDEISGYLAVDPTLYTIDYKVQEVLQEGDATQYRVMIVAVQNSTLAAYVQALKTAGLKVASVDVSANAKEKLVNLLTGQPQNCVVMDLGMQGTTTDTYFQGRFYVNKISSIGLNTAVNSLAAALKTDTTTAWERLRAGDPSPETTAALGDYLEQMLFDSLRVIDYFRSRNGMATIDRVYLCGGGAAIPGIVSLIAERTGLAVEPLTQALSSFFGPGGSANPWLSGAAAAAGATLTEVEG